MKTLSFNCYSDPGHGWIKVSRKVLTKLNIADKVTAFSYERGDHVYLEEDCDASLLIQALELKGIKPVFKHTNTNKSSKIRSYNSYYFG